MGYTHYWTHRARLTNEEWKTAIVDINAIITTSQVPLDATPNKIFLNGIGDDAHETFSITQNRAPLETWQQPSQRGWDFCKTARKPYDIVVTASLIYLSSVHPKKFEVTSDGVTQDWEAGLALAKQALPQLGNILDIPPEIRFDDMFSRYYLSGGYLQLGILRDGTPTVANTKTLSILGRFNSPVARTWITDWFKIVEAKRQRMLPAKLTTLEKWASKELRLMVQAAESYGYLERSAT
jgi:hypothetical protein